MSYIVTPRQGRWEIRREGTLVGAYPTRKQAVTTARVLAGWRGTVTIVKG